MLYGGATRTSWILDSSAMAKNLTGTEHNYNGSPTRLVYIDRVWSRDRNSAADSTLVP